MEVYVILVTKNFYLGKTETTIYGIYKDLKTAETELKNMNFTRKYDDFYISNIDNLSTATIEIREVLYE